MTRAPFRLLDPARRDVAAARAGLAARQPPRSLGSHAAAAPSFQPSDDLVMAINVALCVGAPLLLTGEPGTGKTQVAHYLAWYFGLGDRFHQLDIRSGSTASDLLYQFDTVAYFHASQDPQRRGEALAREQFIVKGPYWRALEVDGPSIILIDEIDKASRDFPNDLLGVLDQGRFFVRERGEEGRWVERRSPDAPPPFVVITSNSERRLPEPFLRRCTFHHIQFDEELLHRAVAARRGDFAGLSEEACEAAIDRVLELRGRDLRKKPATAELLVWLTVLDARGDVTADAIRDAPLRDLPGLPVLVKDREDLELLG